MSSRNTSITPEEDLLDWLQRELHVSREAESRAQVEIDQLRRQVRELAHRVETAEKEARSVEPRLKPFVFLPQKLSELEHDSEQMRQEVMSLHATFDAAVRVLEAGLVAERNERIGLQRRSEEAVKGAETVRTEINQLQTSIARVNEALQDLMQRQTQTERASEQVHLRVERVAEVHDDAEQRLRQEFIAEKEDRFSVVFERLQVVGEMVRRAMDAVDEVSVEQTLRSEILEQIDLWRSEHVRIDGRIAAIEEASERAISKLDSLETQVKVVEGRHTGLADRVGIIRTEINEIIDTVRTEFQKFNQLQEKSRRRQIEAMEQELRELKFHQLRPPDAL